ncbi:hypothetical protein [Burkholderia ubonensis]|uniref:hypothetical protein n=1 Tax=Burkholderia ubonensis TaxID=101571 RepID=UPI0011601D4E|nr:hypothetical protein [Burkholderia ubonensis]
MASYVLRSKGGNYCVGHTLGLPANRIDQHGGKYGAAWSRMHPPVALIETIDCRTIGEERAIEKEYVVTWQYMQRYGWQRVRGGFFTKCDEEETRKNLRAHGFFEATGRRE